MSTSLLSPELVAKIKPMTLRARVVAEGVLSGLHRSPAFGSSIEFAEHKQYTPGDDIRHLDWKALARFDKLYIKKYEEEKNLVAYEVLDTSASMSYRGKHQAVSKFEYAKTLAAALAFLLHQQQDAAGMVFFAGSAELRLPARSSGSLLADALTALEAATCDGKSDFERSFTYILELVRRKNLVLVFTDLLDAGERAVAMLKRLRARKNDVALFHVLDPDELDFPFEELTQFVSIEDERQVVAEPQAVREAYLKEVRSFLNWVRSECESSGIEYVLARTDRAYDEVLLPFLRRRMRK